MGKGCERQRSNIDSKTKHSSHYSPALSTRLPVLVPSHKDTGTTSGLRTFPPQSLDTSIRVDLVVLEDSHLDFFPLVLDLLGSGL